MANSRPAYKVQRVTKITDEDLKSFDANLVGQPDPILAFQVRGTCPTCHHPTADTFPVELYVLGSTTREAAPGATAADRETIGAVAEPAAEIAPEGAPVPWRELNVVPDPAPSTPPQRPRRIQVRRRSPHGTHPAAGASHELATASATTEVVYGELHCRCVHNHGSKDDAFGCGSSWLLQASIHHGAEPPTVDFDRVDERSAGYYWYLVDQNDSAAASSLSTVQGAASKWQTALGGTLGLATVAGLVGGRSTLQGLSGADQALIVILAATVIWLNAAGVWQATLAATGFPTMEDVGSQAALHDAAWHPLRQATTSARNLKSAIGYAAASLVFAAILVFAVAIFPPADPPHDDLVFDRVVPTHVVIAATGTAPATTVTLTTVQATVCGWLPDSAGTVAGQLPFIDKNAPTVTTEVPLSRVVSLERGC